MRIGAIAVGLSVLVCGSTLYAQVPRPLSADDQALNATLRELVAATPLLPAERVEVVVPLKLAMISAAAADKAGNIYVLHRSQDGDPIVVVDPTGKVLRSWGRGMYKIPHSIHVDPQGNIWTTDANTSKVVKYTPEGKKLLEVEVGDVPDGERAFCSVTGIGFLSNGNVLVSDGYCNARILEFGPDGTRVGAWGAKGKGPGEFTLPHDVTVGADGTIYVADRENGRVQWFDSRHQFLGEKTFGGRVYSVAVSPDGKLYLGVAAKGGAIDADANVFRFDPKTGAVEGRLEIMSHETELGADGAIYSGHADLAKAQDPATSVVVVFKPKS